MFHCLSASFWLASNGGLKSDQLCTSTSAASGLVVRIRGLNILVSSSVRSHQWQTFPGPSEHNSPHHLPLTSSFTLQRQALITPRNIAAVLSSLVTDGSSLASLACYRYSRSRRALANPADVSPPSLCQQELRNPTVEDPIRRHPFDGDPRSDPMVVRITTLAYSY